MAKVLNWIGSIILFAVSLVMGFLAGSWWGSLLTGELWFGSKKEDSEG